MKKISLKNLNLKEVEQLSRNQLKEVLGGYVGETNPVTEKKCQGRCIKHNVSGGPEEGACKSDTIWSPTGQVMTICVCNIIGGEGCKN